MTKPHATLLLLYQRQNLTLSGTTDAAISSNHLASVEAQLTQKKIALLNFQSDPSISHHMSEKMAGWKLVQPSSEALEASSSADQCKSSIKVTLRLNPNLQLEVELVDTPTMVKMLWRQLKRKSSNSIYPVVKSTKPLL